jgi:hypothetical protein
MPAAAAIFELPAAAAIGVGAFMGLSSGILIEAAAWEV